MTPSIISNKANVFSREAQLSLERVVVKRPTMDADESAGGMISLCDMQR
ncbi:hypothetical protein OAR53_05595 [Luminiphilus sp.]|jgi:hypothetical protein|nr:hypothetical protein [Luminiphilus sp.]MDA8946020.1 hypothetical protein [Luminiphilus sp.]MDB2440310.1 hypothetical protein [Luminiphilus sp.]MDB2660109.1 hypothetical protein [Luminiphilus sp.]MDC0973789.1 hypothetical protein [Luminiphilus sp.]